MLRLVNISKSFDTSAGRRTVLDGLSFELAAGECAAVVGPSGSGKSTLLHIAGLLDRPDSGSAFVCGRDAATLGNEEARLMRNAKIGFVFQHHFLIPELCVWQNIAFPGLVGEGRFTDALRARAMELVEFLRLGKVADAYPEKLSGGESQRTAIARAIFNSPELLIMDEPTGSLDREMKKEVIRLVKAINRSAHTAVLIATHDESVRDGFERTLDLAAAAYTAEPAG